MVEKEVTIKVTTEADARGMEDINSALDDTKTRAEEVGEALRTAFEEANQTVDELTQELADIEMGESDADFDEISQQLEEARTEAEALADALNTFEASGLDDAKTSADELTDSLSNANDNMDGLSNSMGLMDSMALMDIGSQIGAIGEQADAMNQGLNTANITMGQLATTTGIAEPQLRSMISYISNETFPQSEAMAYVQALNQMGVSADKLGDSATNMDKINDATGIGYEKVMQLTQGLRSMGVTADNLPSSFNAIAYAQSNVNGGASTLTQVLKRQASTINEYGLNVDQLVIIMQKLSEQGVQGMKMGSALSEILKETNGDTTALEQSLGLTAGTLSNASAETSKYSGMLQQMADEEMEHKSVTERLGAVWEDLSLQFSWFISPATDVLSLFEQFGQFALQANGIIKLAETFGILKEGQLALIPVQYAEGTAGWFSIGWIVLAIALGIALGLALVYLYNHSEQFRNAVNWLGQSLKWLAEVIVNNIMNAVNRFREIISAIPRSIQWCLDWANQLILGHPIVQTIIWLGQQMAKGFSVLGLNQHSPGDIYKALKLDLTAMDEETDSMTGVLTNKYKIMGQNISDNFNPSLRNINTHDFANNLIVGSGKENGALGKTEVNNIFNIDYLAKREFVQDIINIIQNEVNWNNSTAGRGV